MLLEVGVEWYLRNPRTRGPDEKLGEQDEQDEQDDRVAITARWRVHTVLPWKAISLFGVPIGA